MTRPASTTARPRTVPAAQPHPAAKVPALAPEGVITVVGAVTGIADQVGDVINPGAFSRTLLIRKPKVSVNHAWDQFVGRVLHVEELMPNDSKLPKRTKDGKPWPSGAGALVAVLQFNLNTFRGREAYEFARWYSETGECEWSIGYKVVPGKSAKRRDGCRIIYDLDLFEISLVLFGAASQTMTLEVKSLPVDDLEYRSALCIPVVGAAMAAVMEAKALNAPGDGNDGSPTGDDEAGSPTHAGLAVIAADTGRVLMLQRALSNPRVCGCGEPVAYDESDGYQHADGSISHDDGTSVSDLVGTDYDPAEGTWEFPGGGIDDGETPEQGARREFAEETGMTAPDAPTVDTYDAPNGIYRLHITVIPSESDLALNPDEAAVTNPDDPKRRNPETTAWFDPNDLPDMPSLRPAVASTPWDKLHAAVGTKPRKAPLEGKSAPRPAAFAVIEAKSYRAGKTPRKGLVKHRCQFCRRKAVVHRAWMGGSYLACRDCDDAAKVTGNLEGKVLGGPHDTSPVGTPGGRQNWVDGVGGLPAYHREIAHALMRNGHSETNAIRIAVGTVKRWKDGKDGVTADTQAKAAAADAEWEAKKAASHAKHAAHEAALAA